MNLEYPLNDFKELVINSVLDITVKETLGYDDLLDCYSDTVYQRLTDKGFKPKGINLDEDLVKHILYQEFNKDLEVMIN